MFRCLVPRRFISWEAWIPRVGHVSRDSTNLWYSASAKGFPKNILVTASGQVPGSVTPMTPNFTAHQVLQTDERQKVPVSSGPVFLSYLCSFVWSDQISKTWTFWWIIFPRPRRFDNAGPKRLPSGYSGTWANRLDCNYPVHLVLQQCYKNFWLR